MAERPLGVGAREAAVAEGGLGARVGLGDRDGARRRAARAAAAEGVVEATREGGGGAILGDGRPADDGEVRQRLHDHLAERVERAAAVEKDALEARQTCLVEQPDEEVRCRQLDRAVGDLERECAREHALAHRVAVARELDDARRDGLDDLLEVVGEACGRPDLAEAARDALLQRRHLAHQLERLDRPAAR
eukprot:5325552-Prymnesium_polylepis.2